MNLPSYKPTVKGNQKQIRQAARAIQAAERPIIVAGGGIITADASEELVRLVDRMQVPVVTTLMGKGCIATDHPLDLGPVGMHGSKFANEAVANADLIIAVGTHFSDRVTGKVEKFAPMRVCCISISTPLKSARFAWRTFPSWAMRNACWRTSFPIWTSRTRNRARRNGWKPSLSGAPVGPCSIPHW